MPLKNVLLFSILLSLIGCVGGGGEHLRQPSSVFKKWNRKTSSVVEGLELFSGSYKLDDGEPMNCPDGEVTTSNKSFVLGASLKISDINSGPQTTVSKSQKECSTETLASFDRNILKYLVKERCGPHFSTSSTYSFQIYEKKKSQYLKLNYNRNSRFEEKKSSSSFECIYVKKDATDYPANRDNSL